MGGGKLDKPGPAVKALLVHLGSPGTWTPGGAPCARWGERGHWAPLPMSQPESLPSPPPGPRPPAPEPAPVAVLALERCPSCAEPARGRFCAKCGQSHADVRVPFGKWLRDYIDDTFHLDSNLVRSLVMLVRRPGALTAAYLEGRRSAYVRPFRLYLTASFFYFLALSLLPVPKSFINVKSGRDADGGVTVLVGQGAELSVGQEASAPSGPPRPLLHEDTEFKRRLNRFTAKGSGAAQEQVIHAISRTMPKAMFVLVPVFALLLRLLYRKTGRFYAEHFLFALHFHAFAFLALALGAAVTAVLGVARFPVMQAVVMAYLFLALRRLHGEGRLRTAFKTAVLYGGYGLILLLTVFGTTMASIYFAD